MIYFDGGLKILKSGMNLQISIGKNLWTKVEFLNQILELEKKRLLLLVYTSGNIEQNNAIILKEVLDKILNRSIHPV